ncbi:Na+/H+ antiporter NhaC family protein [Fusobacterium sp. PH5-44]|uniref:Na+/H+ antiporter NhaC family protein n=1 Tax=unclassified Fusobacterium TaxID=2648384 RepID=UPI003D19F955
MEKVITLVSLIVSFIISICSKSNIGLGITLAILLILIYGLQKGYQLKDLVDGGCLNAKKSFLVIKIFILVGAISATWIVSGTIPGIVYYGIKFINPKFFYLCCFLITSIMSFLIGSSFGTVSTIGIAMMAVGRGLEIDVGIAAGAIIAGAFFGDRCSPVSSSASLVATLTDTELYQNIKKMFKTGTIPFICASLMYLLIKVDSNKVMGDNILSKELIENFNLSFFVFLPVLIILLCALLKVNVKISMSVSICAALLVALLFQKSSIIYAIKSLFWGYELDKEIALKNILKGGGIISMWKASYIILISCFFSGIVEKIKLFEPMKQILSKTKNKLVVYISTVFVSIVTCMFGCNQSIAIVMTVDIMKDIYKNKNISNDNFALDIEDTAVVIAPLIPWNIAGYIPAMVMLEITTFRYIPYGFYLYFLPIYVLLTNIFSKNKNLN